MKDQKDQLNEVLGQLEEDTANLKKARDIDVKLDSMWSGLTKDGNDQLNEKWDQMSQIEWELAELRAKIKGQDKEMADLDAKIVSINNMIKTNQKRKDDIAEGAGLDNLTNERDNLLGN